MLYEKILYLYDSVLQVILITVKVHEVPVFSVVLPIWTRSGRTVWRCKGRITLYVENTPVQSFFKGRV